MKLIITRSFQKTKQVADFEPIRAECSLSTEIEGATLNDEVIRSYSEHLDVLVRQEVERTIEKEMAKVEAIRNRNKF